MGKEVIIYGQHKLQSAIMPFKDGEVIDAAFNEKAKANRAFTTNTTQTNPGSIRENGTIKVVANLAPSVFLPLATDVLHFKNYQL
jgi:hypothetical protein